MNSGFFKKRSFGALIRRLVPLAAILVGATDVRAGTTNTIGSTTFTSSSTLTIAAGNETDSTGTISTTANGTATYNAIIGPGLLQLAATVNGVNSPDIYFNSNDADNGTANWGSAISAPVNLGAVQRVVYGKTNHSGVGQYGVASTDCEFTGVISGSGGLTYIAQDAYTGSNPMECPLALNAANTFTGPLIIQRGSVYLGAANAFPAGSPLQFTVPAGQNGKFFLWGQNATVGNLASSSAGNAVIAAGNRNPSAIASATLTIQETSPTTFNGSLVDTNIEYSPTTGSTVTRLSVTKTGAAALTLTGTNKFTGALTVNAGKLYLNNVTNIIIGAVTVNSGATLGGTSIITTNVTVAAGGSLEAGGGAGSGNLVMKGLVLGAAGADALTLNFTGNGTGLTTTLSVTGASALTNNGTTTINITGSLPSTPFTNTLIFYSGAIKGNGTFVLGTVPPTLTTPYLSNNVAAARLQLIVPAPAAPTAYVTWVGYPLNTWDLQQSNVWRQTGSAIPAFYTNTDNTVFDDAATNFLINLATTVQPASVIFSNLVHDYTISGAGSLSNNASLTLLGTGKVTLGTANQYTGGTTVSAGTLALAAAGAIPAASSVTLNGTLEVAGYSPLLSNLGGTGTVDNATAGGSLVLTVSNAVNSTFTGVIKNTSGSLALNVAGPGTLSLDGTNTYSGGTTIAGGGVSVTGGGGLGTGPVNVTENLAGGTGNFLTISNSGAVTLTNNLALPNATGTYVLTKNATGQLTLNDTITGGGSGLVLRTTTDTTGDTSTVFEFARSNSFAGGLQTYRGVVQVDNSSALGSATVYGDGNASPLGDLSFASSMTFTNPLVLQSGTTVSPNGNTVVMSGAISGNFNLTKYGAGALVLAGNNTFSGTLTAAAGTLGIGSMTLAGDTTASPQINLLNIAAGAVVQSAGTLSLNASSSLNPSLDISGAGTLQLVATNNNALSPDIYMSASDSTASHNNWGAALGTAINLGNAQRFIWGNGNHNGIGQYGLTNGDCQFNGTIYGSGGLTFIAQMTYNFTTPLMEIGFVLNGSNSFTGPVELQRGALYLGNANAISQTNALLLNPASGNTALLFLYGNNLAVANLGSTTNGTSIIANGNEKTGAAVTLAAVTLTDYQNTNGTFAGALQDVVPQYDGSGTGTTGPLGLTKNGPATLTLSGSNSFAGPLTVNQGALLVNGPCTGGGLVTVGSGATLGGSGTIAAAVVVTNGGTLLGGATNGLGTLTVNTLKLGAVPADNLTLNCAANTSGVAGNISVVNSGGLTNNGRLVINVGGVTPGAPGAYTLVSYAGVMQGAGTIVGGTLPANCTGYVTNNPAASAIQLVVTSINIPVITWVGAPLNTWDLLGSNTWKVATNGQPTSYVDGDLVRFDDTASNYLVNLTTTAAPGGIILSNNVNPYLIMGNGQMAGYTGLTKTGAGLVTLLTTNSYTGATLITAGTLALGAPGAIPGGPGAGNVTVNGTLDVAGFSPTLNNLSGSGIVDNQTVGGSPVLTVASTASALFSGAIQNATGALGLNLAGSGTLTLTGTNTYGGPTVITGGTLQLGAGGASGTAGLGTIVNNGVLAFNRSDSNNVANDITGSGNLQQNGPGTTLLSGNLTYSGVTYANAGTLYFPKDITFDAAAGTTLTIAAGARVKMAATVFNLYVNTASVAVDVSGAGTLELTSLLNSIESYSDINLGPNANGTSDFGCRLGCNLDLGTVHRTLYGWTSGNDVTRNGLAAADVQLAGSVVGSAELTLEGQNSLTGGVNVLETQFALNGSNNFTGPLEIERGSVYLGNAKALVTGNVLILDPALTRNSRLFLYGYNAAIADLQSASYGTGLIANGNGASSTNVGPATLTITQNNPTTFTGGLVDWYTEYVAPATGALIPTLSLIKNGPAALTLTGVNTYSGTTVINAGELFINNAATGGGAFTVNNTGTLGGSGVINSAVTLKSGGAIEAGAGNASANLQIKSVVLGSAAADTSTLNLAAAAELLVTNNNGLTINSGSGSVTINVRGSIGAAGTYPLITYAGTLGGTGYAAFTLGSLPPGVVGHLNNNTAGHSVDLVVTAVTIPRWSGALSTAWNTGTLAAPKNWVLNADGVTPIDYVDGETVRFDDTAATPNVNIDLANVAPLGITVSNSVQNYTITGAYGISGLASLTKQGTGRLMLAAANSYSGNTLITAGTLALGAATALPAGPAAGNLTDNGTLDLGGFSASVNNLSGSGVVDNLTAGGNPVFTVVATGSNVFSGALQNTTGTLGVVLTGGGTLTLSGTNGLTGAIVVSNGWLNVSGRIGEGGVALTAGGTLGGNGSIAGGTTLADGATLALTANKPLTAGALALSGKITVRVGGTYATNAAGTYVLLNHGVESGSGAFALVAIPGLSAAGLSAQLNDTNNQLQLIIQPAALTHTIADVKHVVVFVQENRSFDHYFGTLHGVHGFGDRNVQMLSNGRSVLYQPSGSSYELPYHTTVQCINDTDHSWGATHNAFDNDRNDAWVANKGTETMAYMNRSDLAYYYALADAYTVLDDYHCSVRASTDPNRVSLMTGMVDPTGMGAGTVNGTTYPGGPLIDNTEPANGWGPGWVTYPELLLKAGITWKIYQQSDNYDDNALAWFAVYKQAAAGNPLHDQGNVFQANAVTAFQNDVTSNTLPAVSWIIGPTGQSEHPPYSPASGEALTKQFLDALASNPQIYSNTVFILTYDENDGFWDHALPITPPAGTANEFVSGAAIGLGVRVPAIIVSPWTRGGHVCSQVFDHTSILRFLETWTGVREPNISAWRRQVTGDLTSAFDFAHPDPTYPSLPATTPINCSSGSTPAVPSPQVVPVQEAGTLTPRPLPYQPNALPVTSCGAGTFSILLTNSGAASVHFLVQPNAFRLDNPTPYDVAASNSAVNVYSTASTSGNYDLTCYGPNGFQRRFAGNVGLDCNQIEVVSYLNPVTGEVALALANASSATVTFTVTNGYVAGGLATYAVPAGSTNVILANSSTNSGYYDLLVTASTDAGFLRRFLGRVETNNAASQFAASQRVIGYSNAVTLTAAVAGFGVPGGAVQFLTNGAVFGSPVALSNGAASLTTTSLLRGTNLIAAVYSGDQINAAWTNQLVVTVTNHPPVAGPVFLARPAGVRLLIKVSDLLTNATDVDRDTLTLAGFGSDGYNRASTNGATVISNGNYLLYTNSVMPNVNDSFNYTVTDGFGGTNSGTVSVLVTANVPGQSNVQLQVSPTNVTANFFGVPGFHYVVQRSTNLTVGAGWVPISTNTAPTNGLIQVLDNFQGLGIPVPPVPSPVFYRLQYNP